MWQTGGTVTGTRLTRDLAPGEDSSVHQGFLVIGDTLHFAGSDGPDGEELWSFRP